MRSLSVSGSVVGSQQPVIPAEAGIQEAKAEAGTSNAWIPGLAVLARNDDSENSLRISCAQ